MKFQQQKAWASLYDSLQVILPGRKIPFGRENMFMRTNIVKIKRDAIDFTFLKKAEWTICIID